MPALTRPTIDILDEYSVEDGSSVRASLGVGSVSTTRKLMVGWEQSGDVARHFLGFAALTDNRLRRLLPAAHPRDPSLIAVQVNLLNGHEFVAAEGADPETWGSATNRLADQSIGAKYRKAVIEVVYERAKFAMRPDDDIPDGSEYLRYCEMLPPVGGNDLITLPGNGYAYVRPTGATAPTSWDGSPPSLTIPYGLPLPDRWRDIRLRWARVPAALTNEDDPSPWLQRLYGLTGTAPLLGGINKTAFKTWRIGSAELINVEQDYRPAPFANVTINESGTLVYAAQSDCQEVDITFTFRCRNNQLSWNWFYYNDPQPTSGTATNRSGFYPISRSRQYYAPGSTPNGDAPKNEVEFRDLFKVGV